MAQTTQVSASINRRLRYDHAMINELTDMVHEWFGLSDGERTSWSRDWDQFVLGDVPKLADDAQSGRMSPEQVTSYHVLLNRLREQLPAMERLRLTVPAIPLDT